ncbi:NLI interacting factor-like phosphatase family protein, putative [Ichthyophthirius multifiliis]|uniref:Mitochondrial import inner membrane translocase subunit TIM50 n=1 Tax=Ichthyophthirius multifiliis TaxID=5932 RepID=G0QNQ8_ICHMU|nr:NLI interacting factor-like phosphatase family protein, putative [Ichthyophthirius multifiliis]EGR33138.1 NLI interacting factor-like phosphatase family protein, putative [Ichthyophthirius multifiliis]|eukprot:XP_004037124.1 NLI interacting factor-like phosphatase family protein, putative [Ichthyophthirius multifiliis]
MSFNKYKVFCEFHAKKTIVLDLDETLVHSSFQKNADYDLIITIEVQQQQSQVYVKKRPGCDFFIEVLSQYYEIIIFTASLQEYANPVIDYIDQNKRSSMRLFRENCTFLYNSSYSSTSSLSSRFRISNYNLSGAEIPLNPDSNDDSNSNSDSDDEDILKMFDNVRFQHTKVNFNSPISIKGVMLNRKKKGSVDIQRKTYFEYDVKQKKKSDLNYVLASHKYQLESDEIVKRKEK